MIQLQMRVDQIDDTDELSMDFEILVREDATLYEQQIANAAEQTFLKAVEVMKKQFNMNIEVRLIPPKKEEAK